MRTDGRTSQVRALRTCFRHPQWRGTRRRPAIDFAHVDCAGEGSHADGNRRPAGLPRCLVVEATRPLPKTEPDWLRRVTERLAPAGTTGGAYRSRAHLFCTET